MKTVIVEGVEYVEMKFCIVRCKDAGVHAGYVKSHQGREVHLINSRRLWLWYQTTLSELAIYGSTNPNESKYCCIVPEILLLDACEIITCTEIGKKSICEVKEWKQ